MKIAIGKNYSLHFGKNIFVKYKIISIDYDLEEPEATLQRVENYYMGCDEFYTIPLNKLKNKRVIRDW